MLIFQIKRIIRIIQVKNGLTMSFLFFGKCQKFGVDRMVLNGEKKEDGLSLPSNSSLSDFHNPLSSKSQMLDSPTVRSLEQSVRVLEEIV